MPFDSARAQEKMGADFRIRQAITAPAWPTPAQSPIGMTTKPLTPEPTA
jgi:hypothetical protein